MNRVRVGVLRGGPSSEYEVSLKTGATVLKHIPQDGYQVQDICISRDGVWHKDGVNVTPHNAISHADVIFNALHGQYGEDGKVQHILELHRIPFTGSGSFSSAVGMNKAMSKDVFIKENIKTPQYMLVQDGDYLDDKNLADFIHAFSLPYVVKPVSAGSSVGVTIVEDLGSLETALQKAMEHSNAALVEEYIKGVEATVGIIDCYRDQPYYALPPIEIRPHGDKGKTFFDYEAKYEGTSDEIVPGNFNQQEKMELENIARKVHQALGFRHYSRTDFIISPRRGIFVLEANTLPGLTEESLIPKALRSVGASLSHFLDHVLQLALNDK